MSAYSHAFQKFKQDAARWVVPGKQSDPSALGRLQMLKLLHRHMPLRAMAWYRLACWCRHRGIPFFYGQIHRHLMTRFGLEMWGDIGGGLYIAHTVGCIVAVERLGENCTIIAAVTFGMRNERGFPTIGDNVLVGAGARILGNVTIGDNAKIGANAVVLQDVAANATAVGIPAKVIKEHGDAVAATSI